MNNKLIAAGFLGMALAVAVVAGLLPSDAPTRATCVVRLGAASKAFLVDAGTDAGRGVADGVYRQVEIDFVKVGERLVPTDAKGNPLDLSRTSVVDEIVGGPEACIAVDCSKGCATGPKVVDQKCVRRIAATPIANCRRRIPDGGVVNVGVDNVFGATEAVGAGCTPSVCMVVDRREVP